MTREEAEEILTKAGEGPDEGFPLFEAALACAVHDDPSRNTQPAIDLARDAVERLRRRNQRPHRVGALVGTVRREHFAAGRIHAVRQRTDDAQCF